AVFEMVRAPAGAGLGGAGAPRLACDRTGTAETASISRAIEGYFISLLLDEPSPSATTAVRLQASGRLHDVRNEALSLLHVGSVRLADGVQQRSLLDHHSIAVGSNRRNREEGQAQPAPECEPNPYEHHHSSGIRRMPHQPIRPRADHGLLSARTHIASEILAERPPAVTP